MHLILKIFIFLSPCFSFQLLLKDDRQTRGDCLALKTTISKHSNYAPPALKEYPAMRSCGLCRAWLMQAKHSNEEALASFKRALSISHYLPALTGAITDRIYSGDGARFRC